MPAGVHVHRWFQRDVERQAEWLEEHSEAARLRSFLAGLRDAQKLIARFPAIGTVLMSDERVVLRELPFPRRLPYLLQYVHEPKEPIRRVWLVRLFHHGQRRAEPDLSGWPW